jgi:5-methyltetrahydropteroyltriglutamate--homocysteine methyltransferase
MLDARQRGDDLDPSAFEDALAEAVRDLVVRQSDAGIDIVSDGEVSKHGFISYLRFRLEGLGDGSASLPLFDDVEENREEGAGSQAVISEGLVEGSELQSGLRLQCCVGPLSYQNTADMDRDIANLTSAVAGVGVAGFVPAASPGLVAYHTPNAYYPTYEEYIMALSEAMKTEYEAIAKAGLSLQLDAPDLAAAFHSKWWATPDVDRLGMAKFVDLHIEAINVATADIPPAQLRIHLCYGNYPGPHTSDRPLVEFMEPILRRARPSLVSFEAANPRHEHEYTIFEELDLPDDKVLVPGVVGTTEPRVEHPELIAQRLIRFASLVGRERVIAGAECGFSTIVGYETIAPATVWLKLRSIAEGAAIASDRLWSSSAA